MTTAIIIPARYHSTRFPGKPLAVIAGKTMLERVVTIARNAVAERRDVSITVATDDARILAQAAQLNVAAVMTPEHCATGTDRALAAIEQLPELPQYIINLQGDVPLTPPHFISALITTLQQENDTAIATPVVQLTWEALSQLRQYKQQTPFSGTTAIIDSHGYALWFSKQIIPAIRNEEKLRQHTEFSPVYRHIGLYGYTLSALRQFAAASESHYEKLEGLEQLRALENNIPIKTVLVSYQGHPEMTGVDTEEDARRVEQLIEQHGELA